MGLIIIGLIAFIAFKDNVPLWNKPHNLELLKEGATDLGEGYGDAIEGEKGEQKSIRESETIKIYIVGQVQEPGVIEVPSDCRLNEAVEMAGGFLPDADLLKINLAIRVQDEGMYIIPKIGEESSEFDPSVMGLQDGGTKVNINTADQAQLETLPRIGPVTAKKIIDYREQNGAFKMKEDLMNIPGIGEKTFEGLKDLIAVR